MSDKKAPKLKFANVASKIDSGLSNKSSATTVKPRQPSEVSRASSRQSNPNPIERQPFSTSKTPIRSRPATDETSTKLQKSIHKLGTLPRYLQQTRRPATAGSRLQTREEQLQGRKSVREAPKKSFEGVRHQKHGSDVMFKNTLDGIVGQRKKIEGVKRLVPKVVRREGTWSMDQNIRPPCEGCGDTQEQQRKIYELLVKIETKAAVIKEREDDIEQLKSTVENLCTISTSRDTISRDGLRDLELKLSKIQADVIQKNKELMKSEQKVTTLERRIDELNQQLVDAESALEDKQSNSVSLKDRLEQAEKARRSSEELAEKLQRKIESLKEEIISKRDDQIKEQKSIEAEELFKAELEDRKAEMENLRVEVNRLQYEKLLLNIGEQITSRIVDEDKIQDETEPEDAVDLI